MRAIASRPHPAGSPEAALARDYILTELGILGVPAEVQQGVGLYQRNSIVLGGRAENVVARLKGTGPGRAVLLSSHYDSVRSGPGAGDDGHAVGVLLETARVLKSGPPLKNDVIFLFDVEETGMTGADAFARRHPWRHDVDVVVNFEARGTDGPDFMFQTSEGNRALIREFAAAVPYPVATSLAYEIYKRLPNDTDLSVFKRYHYAGYDFAFIGNVLAYHTGFDDLERLDPATVQHAGTNALSLARRLGNADLAALRNREGDAVYFSVGRLFVHYPAAWVGALSLAALALVFWVVSTLRKRGAASWKGVTLGALSAAIVAALAGFGMDVVWRAIRLLHPSYDAFVQYDVYAHDWYVVAFFAITFALFLGGYLVARRYASAESFAAGGVALNALLLIPLTIVLPGGSYILLWPVVGGALALLAGPRRPLLAALASASAPALILQFAYFGFTGLTMHAAGISSALFALTLALSATPILSVVGDRSRRWLASAGAVLILALIGGAWANRVDERQPLQNEIAYISDADSGATWWVSHSSVNDPWLQQFLGASPERVSHWYGQPGTVMRAPAPRADVPAPVVTVTSDETARGKRRVGLKVVSQRRAVVFYVQVLNEPDLIGGAVEDIAWRKNAARSERAGWAGLPTVEYTAPAEEGATLTFEVRAGTKLKLRVLEPVQGLPHGPQFHWQMRTPGLLAAPAHPFSDDTVSVRTYEF